MFSQTIIVGRFARDPELSTVAGQNPKAKAIFTIAWDHPYKKDNSQFTRCVAWGKQAEIVGKYCKKGRTVTVTGVLVNSTWEKTVGSEKVTMNSSELEIDQIRFVDAANTDANNQQQQQQQPAWGSQAFGRIEQQQQPQVQQPQVQQPQVQQQPQQPQFSNPGEPINQPGTMSPAAFQQQPQYTPEQLRQMQMQQQQQQQYNPHQNLQPQAPQGMQQQVNPHYNPQTQPQMGLPTQQNPYPGVEEDDLPF